jgi:hypothetical protein
MVNNWFYRENSFWLKKVKKVEKPILATLAHFWTSRKILKSASGFAGATPALYSLKKCGSVARWEGPKQNEIFAVEIVRRSIKN